MKQALSLSTKQSLKMTPQLQQAIKLLQLSSLEFEWEIKEALESNPMLETLEITDTSPGDLPVDTKWDSVEPDLEFQYSHNNNEYDAPESYTAAEPSLQEHLQWQLNLTPFSDRDRVFAITIIDSLNESGYLQTTIEDLRSSLQHNYPEEFEHLDNDEIIAVLHRIQQFDPIGVASRTLQECMLIQLNSMPHTTPFLNQCKELAENYLDFLANKNYSQLKHKLKINESELQVVINTITRLHPHPGELISAQQSEYVVPDVIVSKINKRWTVELNQNWGSNIRINQNYVALIKRADDSRDNQFLRNQLQEAKWFLNSVKNRNETLLKVATCIVSRQLEFLEHGEEHMQALNLNDVAEAVGLNESTISRVTTKKYLHTPRGVYELKFFFSGAIMGQAGNNCSSTAIKAIIRKLISKENPEQPLSDQDITVIMLDQGLKISRRTVAKYRESMGIRSSNQRKK